MSPMSGNVIGSREIRVTSDKVDVTGLTVQVISGLTLNILPDVDLESCYHAHVDISEMLHSKYQAISILRFSRKKKDVDNNSMDLQFYRKPFWI